MNYYTLYGHKIETDLEFVQLVRDESDAPAEIFIKAGTIPEDIVSETERNYVYDKERSWLSNPTTWLVMERGEKITYFLKEGGKVGYMCTYILGWGISTLLLQRGEVAMHCSAVADERGAILIAGNSGAGKSTATTAILEAGFRLMADDVTALERMENGDVYAKPAFPFQKLCRDVVEQKNIDQEKAIYIDEFKDKFLVPYEGEFSTEPVKVRKMIVLTLGKPKDGSKVLTVKPEGIERFYTCAEHVFLKRLLKNGIFAPEIGQKVLQLAAGMEVCLIVRDPEADTREEVLAAIRSEVES